jgi:release factor glutamine methyltransferase
LVAQLKACSIAEVIEQANIVLTSTSDSAKLDAQLLLAFVLTTNVTYLLTWPEKQLTAEQFRLFQQLLIRRVNGEPIAYIVGEQEFWSLTFKVSPVTLIPRPDTELLVEQVLTLFADSTQAIKCLDLGTGTGAIALALASEQPHWQIDAIDFSDQAVALARSNAENLLLTQVNIYQSHWFVQINNDKKFNVIVANPPYIDEQDPHLLQGDVRFEPKSALVASLQGLSDIKHIAEHARQHLENKGYLLLEHGFQQGYAVQQILTNLGYQSVVTVKDLAENERVTIATWLA